MTDSVALLAVHVPPMNLLVISVLSSLIPIAFAVWLVGWLGKAKDGNAEEEIVQQAKSDKEHIAQHGGHGHGHGHGHDDDHKHHAHA